MSEVHQKEVSAATPAVITLSSWLGDSVSRAVAGSYVPVYEVRDFERALNALCFHPSVELIVVEGARFVGKTTFAQRLARVKNVPTFSFFKSLGGLRPRINSGLVPDGRADFSEFGMDGDAICWAWLGLVDAALQAGHRPVIIDRGLISMLWFQPEFVRPARIQTFCQFMGRYNGRLVLLEPAKPEFWLQRAAMQRSLNPDRLQDERAGFREIADRLSSRIQVARLLVEEGAW